MCKVDVAAQVLYLLYLAYQFNMLAEVVGVVTQGRLVFFQLHKHLVLLAGVMADSLVQQAYPVDKLLQV